VDLEKIAEDRRQHVQAIKLALLDKKKQQQQLKDVIRQGTQKKSFVQQETKPPPSVITKRTRTKNKKKEKMSLLEFLNTDLSGQLSGGPGHTPYGMYT
jgi:lipid II:glycine glycyltransferase (peptidoglycan interpeptide bridge formation enzyme)